ncbi:hypothetical protein AB4Z51_43410 [Bradyrhizobium sp. 2TAF36]|uniref:helix-hairpin-helix domain-containing protein n=1 Tax=Bradyrhizobium sp. 2TAF36 TaxID=3233016 RepID=UPI003F9330AA
MLRQRRRRAPDRGRGRGRTQRLALAWKEKLAEGDVVVWLDEHGFEQRLAKKIIRLWGAEAAAKLRESPYVMMAPADWPVVYAAGREASPHDPRHLVVARTTRGSISTTPGSAVAISSPPRRPTPEVRAGAGRGGGRGRGRAASGDPDRRRLPGRRRAHDGALRRGPDSREMLAEPAMGDLITREVSDAEFNAWLDRPDLVVALDDEQREAIQERFGIVRGCAGVGKTMVLKAVARARAAFGRTTHTMALGRAASGSARPPASRRRPSPRS